MFLIFALIGIAYNYVWESVKCIDKALRDEKEARRNVKTRINKINDDGVMFPHNYD